MLGTHKLIVDEWAEVYDLLKPYADASFWQWPTELDKDAVYIVGRNLLKQHWQAIVDWCTANPGRMVFSNPAEGSQTILLQLQRLRITDLVMDGRMGLLTSGRIGIDMPYCGTDCYFSNIVEYLENLRAHASVPEMRHKTVKPNSFLMLNGRLRPHRKAMIDTLRERGLLEGALWTNLNAQVEMSFTSALVTNQIEPIRLLPPDYEIERALPNMQSALQHSFCKHHLFANTWGDAVINPRAYVDTYFSVVTETIFDYPHTFRTEKIWKPMIMEHPFVVAANAGYYKDLRAAGFKTFDKLIDETFDSIDDPQQRVDRIADTIEHICVNGIESFWSAAADICKYNYHHLREHNRQQRARLPVDLQMYLDSLTQKSKGLPCLQQ
jgi:hypothetical protein